MKKPEEHLKGVTQITSWDMHICQDIENGEVLLGIVLYDKNQKAIADIHWGLESAKREYAHLGEALKELYANTGRTDLGKTEH